ncbi:MAG: gliding motility-associated ABC transporter substrate-binding protein GldG [Haliscomenobacter sp.]|uniref:gliding motility-associated ABC transporter substrate-binding protein GldG n=1 Tax=Haliscomenobacter sp. TaxID=2717303 RepID=UPI0029AC3F47|nr:gliding motility-associated ABC transporter substrate-binding protein GldG [Haliscomenobacter sp.]MDX2069760.1 gliding motility-associated ABC transporter substrate-binding protein GldG [Haliscomenobacter sp.]
MSKSKKTQSLLQMGLFLGIVVFINILANARLGNFALYRSFDLTEEKRFTLTDGTKNMLRNLDEVVYVKVMLDGKLPAELKRLRASTIDILDDFRGQSALIDYDFENPMAGKPEQVNARMEQLRKEGMFPMSFTVVKGAQRDDTPVFPYAVVNYKGRAYPVNLMENQDNTQSPDVVLNNAVSLLEYKLANAIQKLQEANKPNVVFTMGHGELGEYERADFEGSLRKFCNTGTLVLDSVTSINPEISALIVAKPLRPFSEKDKFKIDQYVMGGGKILWMLDMVRMDKDSLFAHPEYIPGDYQLNLDDLLFRYGVRVQPNLVLDLQCSQIWVATGKQGSRQQRQPIPFPYHILTLSNPDHPVSKSVAPVNMLFASTIDTAIRTKTSVKKTALLSTTPRTRLQYLPARLGLDFLRYIQPDKFNKGPQVVAVALEGTFPSMYENRLTPEMESGLTQLGLQFKSVSAPTRQIVVSDGDVAKNKYLPTREQVVPLGYSDAENFIYANKEFLQNAVEYLLDKNGIIAARGKEVRLRMLDTTRAQEEKTGWQVVNIVFPLILIGIFGFGYGWWRKRRYARV